MFSTLWERLSGIFGFRRTQKSVPAVSVPRPRAVTESEKSAPGERNRDRMAMQTLESSLKAGRITPEEYATRLARISETRAP